jgi:PAS domain S-box-containing protein
MANLFETPLRDLLSAAPLTLGLWTTAAAAAQTLLDAGAGEALVLDAGRPLGVVTTRGLARVLVREPGKAVHLAAGDLMDPVAVSPETDRLVSALRHMLAAPSRRLAVVDATGKALGILAPFHAARLCAGIDELGGVTVASAMARAVVTATVGEPLTVVLDRMIRMGVGGVVVAEADRPRGMFTARDAVGLLAGGRDAAGVAVESVMRTPVVAVSPQLPLAEAIGGMDGAGAGRLAVTDAAGYLVGLLTWTDAAKALSRVVVEAEAGSLRERSELFRDLYDNAAQGLFRLDASGRLLAANKTMARLLGYRDVAELLRHTRHPGHPLRLDVPERRDLLVRTLTQTEPVSFETMAYRQDGSATHIVCAVRLVRDALGGPRHLEGVCCESPAIIPEGTAAAQEAGYRSLVEHQTELICRLDPAKRPIFVNAAYARYWGKTPEVCLAEDFAPEIPEEDMQRRDARMEALSPERPTTGFEHRVLRSDGRERWQRWTCRAVFDAAGALVEYQCVGRDVTARRHAQQLLRAHAGQARALLEALPVPVFAKDAAGRLTGCNPALEDLTSRSRERLLGKRLTELLPPREAQCHEEMDKLLLAKGGRQTYEADYDGLAGLRRLRIQKAAIRDPESGDFVGIAGVALDVTEHRRAEEAAVALQDALDAELARLSREIDAHKAAREQAEARQRGAQQFLDIVLSAISDGVCVLSPDMTLLSANRALRALYPDRGEMVGRKCHEVFHDLGMPCHECPTLRALATHKLSMSVVPKNEGGRQAGWVELFSYPLLDERGDVTGVVEIVRDVTAGRKLEAELAAALERAEAASQAKGAFLANMSHEIRTPLNAVIGYVQLLRGDNLEPRQRQRLGVVEESAAALLSIINDILDYSKIEAGRMELKAETFDLPRCLEAVLKEQEVLAREKGLNLTLAMDPDLPRTIRGDGLRLRQVLRNLVNNAVKYTLTGGVTLRAACLGQTADAGVRRATLRLSVTDTGVGIPLEQQETIFDSFTQVDTGLTKRQAGTGLGLAICRRLAGLLGGEVHMRSVPGEGSTFWLDCPFVVDESAPGPRPAAVPTARSETAARLRILLVEDNRVNRLFAADLLESRGHSVVVAENGRAALEFLAAERVDVVLMDIQMPIMDGLSATRAIRAGHMNIDPALPVIGLSAYAMDQERERFLAAGLDDYITKPIDVDAFFEVVRRVLAGRGRTPALEATTNAGSCDVLDTAGLASLYHNKKGLLVRVGQEFVASVPEQLRNLETALADGDMRVCERVAHTLKGNAAMFGAKALRAVAALMEVAAASDDAAEVHALAGRLREACCAVVAGMDDFLRRMTV